MASHHVLVTGATGFIGRHVCELLLQKGHKVRAAVRRNADITGVESVIVGDINQHTDWSHALAGIESVIHLAARVHVLKEQATNPLESFREVNVQGTLHLAEAAHAAGVKRFIFVSSIGVNGDETPVDRPFTENDPPSPKLPYAVAKWEAEQALQKLNGLELVIVRPPLVYGPDAPGNFRRFKKLVEMGLPLPFGSVNNRRSMIAVQNLADFLVTVLEHPNAAGETFLIGDDENLSTTDLIRRLSKALGRSVLLLPIPANLMITALSLIGKKRIATQLLSSLTIDHRKATQRLNWHPPLTVDAAFASLKEN
jgi:nucleoside-diphosphate-sugar epimerase